MLNRYYIRFVLIGTERVGLPAKSFVAVIEVPDIVPIPHAPSLIAGAVSYRGRIAIVLHPDSLFGISFAGPAWKLLLFRDQENLFALPISKLEDEKYVLDEKNLPQEAIFNDSQLGIICEPSLLSEFLKRRIAETIG